MGKERGFFQDCEGLRRRLPRVLGVWDFSLQPAASASEAGYERRLVLAVSSEVVHVMQAPAARS